MGKHHEHREDLTGEHRIGHAGQLVCAVAFGVVWVLDTFVVRLTTQLGRVVPLAVRLPVAIPMLGLALWLAWTSLRIVFGQVRATPAVIRTGVYRVVRHPMYLSEVLLCGGLVIASLSVAAAVVMIGAVVFFVFLCGYEERLLVQRFGDDYRTYMREAGMWLPRVRRTAS